jgi:Tol biopolymer transport system component
MYIRFFEDFVAQPIAGTEGAKSPFFSPDGESVAFFSSGQLKRVSVRGGSPRSLFTLEEQGVGGTWFEDTIVFATRRGLFRISARGGEPQPLALTDSTSIRSEPQILPGGEIVLVQTSPGEIDGPPRISLLSLETGEQQDLLQGGVSPRYTSSGHLVYVQADTGGLMAVPFDLESLEVGGEPVQVLEGIRFSRARGPGFGADYDISPQGVLVYFPDPQTSRRLVWMDREGNETLVTPQRRAYVTPKPSPDGKRMLVPMRSIGFNSGVEIYDIERDSFSPLTNEGIMSGIWSPDGEWITYLAFVDGYTNIYRQRADRSADPEQLTHYTDQRVPLPTSWSPDGRILLFKHQHLDSVTTDDIRFLDIQRGEGPQDLIVTPNHETGARFSPDGKWLAYVSDETGELQVWVCRYPDIDRRWVVSGEEGGGSPVWSPDGRELFYHSGNRMMAVSIETEPVFRAGKPQFLFERSFAYFTPGFQRFEISPDGRFLMVGLEEAPTQIHVILNWFEELKRLVPTD